MEYIRRRADGYGYRKGLSGYFPGMQRDPACKSGFGRREGSYRVPDPSGRTSCLLPALPFDIQIDAETDSEVYLLPTGVLRQIMEKNLHLENFIYKKINESFSDIIAAIQKILFASLEQRLAGFLLDESGGSEDGKIYMTQEQIAKAIGSAREAVSRTLKVLVKEGCVELFRGGVAVLDRKQLYRKL